MNVWKTEFVRAEAEDQIRRIAWLKHYNAQACWSVVFKRHEAEWILPYPVALKIPYNPRHLPVVLNREMNIHEPSYNLYLSIRRIVHGYRAGRSPLPPSPFME